MFLLDNEKLKSQLEVQKKYKNSNDDLTETSAKYDQAKEEYDRVALLLKILIRRLKKPEPE